MKRRLLLTLVSTLLCQGDLVAAGESEPILDKIGFTLLNPIRKGGMLSKGKEY